MSSKVQSIFFFSLDWFSGPHQVLEIDSTLNQANWTLRSYKTCEKIIQICQSIISIKHLAQCTLFDKGAEKFYFLACFKTANGCNLDILKDSVHTFIFYYEDVPQTYWIFFLSGFLSHTTLPHTSDITGPFQKVSLGYVMCLHFSENKAVDICHICDEFNPHVTIATTHLDMRCAVGPGFRHARGCMNIWHNSQCFKYLEAVQLHLMGA